VKRLDIGAHLHVELGVEVGEGFVEEAERGVAHDGAAHGDALALAAGKLSGAAVEEIADLKEAGGFLDAGAQGAGA